MRTYNKNQLLKIKAKIKGLAAEGVRTHQILRTKQGPERDKYWQLKREIGVDARHYLIAYALLRGKSFADIEPNANMYMARYNINLFTIKNIIDLEKPWSKWTIKDIESSIFSNQQSEAA